MFENILEALFIERMDGNEVDGNEEIFAEVMNDPAFRNMVAGHLIRQVYGKIRDEQIKKTCGKDIL